jgi:plasmid stabilization system protein ParE
MEVHWTETAAAHLDNIYRYIAIDSERYALRTVDIAPVLEIIV